MQAVLKRAGASGLHSAGTRPPRRSVGGCRRVVRGRLAHRAVFVPERSGGGGSCRPTCVSSAHGRQVTAQDCSRWAVDPFPRGPGGGGGGSAGGRSERPRQSSYRPVSRLPPETAATSSGAPLCQRVLGYCGTVHRSAGGHWELRFGTRVRRRALGTEVRYTGAPAGSRILRYSIIPE